MKNKKTGIVDGHAHHVIMCNCTFKVSTAGRDRVRREKKKNVHAGIIGIPCEHMPDRYQASPGQQVLYNPYKYDGFILAGGLSGDILVSAEYIEMTDDGRVYAYGKVI